LDLDALKAAIQQQYRLINGHAILEMAADQIPPDEVWNSLLASTSEVIEDYPEDPRGPSCLLLSLVNGQPIHTVVAYPARRHAVLATIRLKFLSRLANAPIVANGCWMTRQRRGSMMPQSNSAREPLG
jgi:hypothetical protein